MAPIELPYLCSDVDRRGNVRWYVRMPGKRKVRIRADVGSEAFIEQYWTARRGETFISQRPSKPKRGTFRWLVDHYYSSRAFADLDAAYTRVERRRQLDPLVEKIGDKAAIIPVMTIRDGLRDRERAAGRKFIAALRHVYQVGVEDKLVDHDPTFGIKVKKPVTDGYVSWSLPECLAYEKRWPLGTQQRTAYAIGLYLGCRRSDAVRIGRRQEEDGGRFVTYTQHKGRGRSPVTVTHPIVPPLREALNAWQGKGFTWLETAWGRPRSDKAFGGAFSDWCKNAGLEPGRSFHGLRKALAARLAEAGYSTNQINAVLGDKTLQQAEVYTRAAEKKQMARTALTGLFGEQIVPVVPKTGTKRPKKH